MLDHLEPWSLTPKTRFPARCSAARRTRASRRRRRSGASRDRRAHRRHGLIDGVVFGLRNGVVGKAALLPPSTQSANGLGAEGAGTCRTPGSSRAGPTRPWRAPRRSGRGCASASGCHEARASVGERIRGVSAQCGRPRAAGSSGRGRPLSTESTTWAVPCYCSKPRSTNSKPTLR